MISFKASSVLAVYPSVDRCLGSNAAGGETAALGSW